MNYLLQREQQPCTGPRFSGYISMKAVWLALVIIFSSLPSGTIRSQVKVRRIHPGVRILQDANSEIPFAAQIVEINLKSAALSIEAVKAGNRLIGKEPTSVLVARNRRSDQMVLAAVNGDFFAPNGIPANIQIINGEIVKMPISRSIFAIAEQNKPAIGIFSLKASIITKDSLTHIIDSVNGQRTENALTFYNKFRGDDTGTNTYGSEVRLVPLQQFQVNTSLEMRVTGKRISEAPMRLNGDSFVLSGHGLAEVFLKEHIEIDDTVRLRFTFGNGHSKITAAVGGTPRLLRDGKISVEWKKEGASKAFARMRHPRTAVGYNAPADTLYFVTIDGRREGYSIGMTLDELAKYMRKLGCSNAVNLDGGGSTTMVVKDSIINRPSDPAGERPVSNALLLVSKKQQRKMPDN